MAVQISGNELMIISRLIVADRGELG